MKLFKLYLVATSVVLLSALAGCSNSQQTTQEPEAKSGETVDLIPTSSKTPPPARIQKNKPGEGGGRGFHAEKVRSTEPVVFTNQQMSLTIAPDASVSLKRTDTGAVISNKNSKGWSIYNWWNEEKTKERPIRFIQEPRFALDNMAKVGPNKILLWSSDGKYEVQVAITPKERYFTFELLHASNNPATGELDDDWPGHRVEFDLQINAQQDKWKLSTMRLNPMSELKGRWNYFSSNSLFFSWPYPQWAQTKDRPQPQGLVGVLAFKDDEEHDDILADIWVGEPSLPRPNRANLKSWTRKDVDAWVDECEKFYATPLRTFNFSPTKKTNDSRGWGMAPETLFPAADLAAKGGMNSIYMSQHHWQDHNIGKLSPATFPGGREQGIAWRKHCDKLGIRLQFHGFSHLIRKPDPDYGWGVVHDDLAQSARGKLLQDVPAEASGMTILVEPDLDYHIGMKGGMLPFYDINKLPRPRDYNGAVGGTFPPYYEGMASLISLNKNLYKYSVSLTPDNKWKIVLGKGRWGRVSKTPLVEHKKGDTVDFVLTNANGNYFLPDSRSDLLVQQAIGYAKLLNDMKTFDGYDGSAWTEDLGSWGLRRFSQEVYERMDHPGGGKSAIGIILFGHFEANFKRLQKTMKSRSANIPVFLATSSMLAPSYDDACRGATKGANRKNIGLRAIHSGLSLDIVKNYGLWEEAGAMLTMWSDLKPHLSEEQAKKIGGSKDGFYVASETDDQWQLTKHRALLRQGVDSNWNSQPERPPVTPRQYLKADGESLTGLHNPYASQQPEVELHVMADMSHQDTENVSLMPTKAEEIINPKGTLQPLSFENGNLTVSYDNSKSSEPYEYSAPKNTVMAGHWNHQIDMSNSRGVAITVEGDGSGSTLIFSTDSFPRMYVVDIDFVGKRTIEIPIGEVCNNRAGWNIYKYGTISQFNYDRVKSFRLFFHQVPAGKKAKVKVLDVKAMKENRGKGLIDPVLNLNGVQVSVQGSIPYNHYLVYKGDSEVKVYDSNWNFVNELPVQTSGKFTAQSGKNTFSVTASQSPNTFVSSRIKVSDTKNPIVVKKP